MTHTWVAQWPQSPALTARSVCALLAWDQKQKYQGKQPEKRHGASTSSCEAEQTSEADGQQQHPTSASLSCAAPAVFVTQGWEQSELPGSWSCAGGVSSWGSLTGLGNAQLLNTL